MIQRCLSIFFIAVVIAVQIPVLSAKTKTHDMTQTTSVLQEDKYVTLHTTAGDIRLRLFGDTPLHQANFIKLATEGYYNDLLFHRVINDFMIQGGDPDSRNAPKGKMLGTGDPSYQLDAEIVYPHHFHRRGALAAARQGDQVNPERRSSGSQFYIVTGKTYTPEQLTQMERQLQMSAVKDEFDRLARQNRDSIMTMRRNRDTAGLQALQEKLVKEAQDAVAVNPPVFTPEQREAYTTVGGTPHLDGSYTVFGQVEAGMDVVDRIQHAETDRYDRPVDDIRITGIDIE